ncbi:tetratricopeptide repeat protein [Fulvivirga ligni]|uniref:tetratricopeptide repeat protein n=1 Tax=Fulvivirga ligni TaxID=2904246 RepID=UPI001F1651C4|nr:tetratricopeptide repeat protein [Fulvivirga ligni]UII23963.1 tetratricopeptide repeat protein [Fulvivirga ligni]
MLQTPACKWLYLALLFTVYINNCSNAQNDISARQYYDIGYHQISTNIDSAIYLLSRSIQLDSSNQKAIYQRGVAYLKSGAYEKALADFKIVGKPASIDNILIYTGFAYQGTSKPDSAKTFFYSYISRHPQDTTCYYQIFNQIVPHPLGDFKLNDLPALDDQLEVLNEKYQYYRYSSFIEAGNFEKALEASDELLSMKSGFYKYYLYKAKALNNLKKYEEAIYMYNIATMKKPEAETYFRRARTYENMEEYESAIKDYERAIEMGPAKGKYYAQIGNCLSVMGQKEAACNQWEKAKELGYFEDNNKLMPSCD